MDAETFISTINRDVLDFARQNAAKDTATGIPRQPKIDISKSEMAPEVFNFELNPAPEVQAPSGGGQPAPPSTCVHISTVDFGCGLCSPGFLYVVGDILILPGVNGQGDGTICPPGGSPTFQLQVTSVDGSGAVTGITIIPGIGFAVAPSGQQAFNGGSGSAFNAFCTFA